MSTSPKLVDDGWHECGDCSTVWHGSALQDIRDYFQRVEAGGKVPSGECPSPDCGALCYVHKPRGKVHGFGWCDEVTHHTPFAHETHSMFPMRSETDTCPTCRTAAS